MSESTILDAMRAVQEAFPFGCQVRYSNKINADIETVQGWYLDPATDSFKVYLSCGNTLSPDRLTRVSTTSLYSGQDPADVVANFRKLGEDQTALEALEVIYDYLGTFMLKGKEHYLQHVDNIIRLINVEEFTPEVLIGFLTITFPYKDGLKERASFFKKVEGSLEDRLGAESARSCLKGLT